MIMRYLAFILLSGILIRVEGQVPDYFFRARQIHENIFRYFTSPEPELFKETTDSTKNRNSYSYLWPVCALIQASNEMEVIDPGKEYLQVLLKTIEHYSNPDPPAPGYQAYVTSAGKDTRYYDDDQWIGIALMDAYERTKRKEYLDLSKKIYRFMLTGYDTVSGGGIYWREGDKTTKNTCSNGPGIILSLQLYKATKEEEYLNTSYKIFYWVNRYLKSPDGIYYDALKVDRMTIDSSTYTYNTGTMLQSYVLLYNITSDKTYLHEAKRIALNARQHFYKKNKLPDNYWFNAVMLRGFIALSRIDGNTERLQFFVDDAEKIWAEQRDERGLIGRRPAKRLIDQAAMLEIFARLEQVFGEKR